MTKLKHFFLEARCCAFTFPYTFLISRSALFIHYFFHTLQNHVFLILRISFCGSFTTFSTFSFDVVTWISEGKTTRALSYVAANNVCSVAAAGVGMMLVKKILAKA
mmetsp:Transcript_1956/g.4582  ORF Transcript_1956/g.4582 Transcript_1956/m.4582 type:complete len:106 (-) Transcript_1956:803-1120(-)